MVFRGAKLVNIVLMALVGLITSKAYSHCVQSFNAYGPIYAPSTLERTRRFMKEILQDQCEVVHLQEVWNSSQIQLIEESLDLSYISYAPNKKNRNGLMSLSRWDLMRSEYVPFRYNSDGSWFDGGRKLVGVEKGFAVQWLSTPQGAFAFINLHLHPSSKAVRIAQILQLIKWRIRNPYSHLMITGDFNMTPKSVERALIMYGLKVKDAAERFFGGYDSSFCTYCTTNRLSWLAQSRVFDYVFYSGPISILDVEVNLKGSVDYPLSDHYGLKVSWEFLKEDAIHSYDEFDVRSLKKVLSLAGEKIRKEYLKSTELDQLLQTWREQLINKNGSFWNYLIRDR